MSDLPSPIRRDAATPATTFRGVSRAFTLVELLVVIAIIVVLSSMILPALKGTLDAVNLTGAAEGVSSQLSLARQTAMSRNLPVEVRVYNHPSGTEAHYDTIALVIPGLASGRAVDEWVNIGTPFSGGVIIDYDGTSSSGEKFSTIFNAAGNPIPTTLTPSPPGPWTTNELNSGTTAPPALRGLTYYAFRFQPDGSTDLPSLSPDGNTAMHWCMSLRNLKSKPPAGNASVPASNYVSLVIDPRTGRLLSYRP